MNLISCNNCAVILDKDKLNFADDLYDDTYSIDITLGAWNQDKSEWEAFINCPVCNEKVFK